MDVFTEIPELSGSVLTIGVFDGVHLGHQALLARLVDVARAHGVLAGVVTFDPYPDEFFLGKKGIALTLPEEREALLGEGGADFVVRLRFDDSLADMTAEEFARTLLPARPRGFVLGPDFVFGRSRSGRAEDLARLTKPAPAVEVVPPFTHAGMIVSSTLIRSLLLKGEVAKARELLGRPYRISGVVVAGKGKGRDLGTPTANLSVDARKLVPAPGVYAARAWAGDQPYTAGVFIGAGEIESRSIEAHLIGYRGPDLYGSVLALDLVEFVRKPEQFADDRTLASRIRSDLEVIADLVGRR